MKISRNTHTASSSSYRSSSKPSKPSSSSSSKPAKSSAAPSKPAKSSSPSKQVKPSLPPSKPQKTNPVPSKPVKKSTNSTLSKTVKKDSNSSKLITTGSGKTSSQSVNNVNVTKTGKVSNDNKKVSGGVKPVVQPNVVQSSKKNHKKDNNTDKKKRPNNGRESNNIVRGNYSITRSKTFSRENNYIKPVTKKFNSQQVLNGSAINIPSDMIPKGKKKNSTFFDMKPVADYLGRQGKKLVASGVVLMSALGKAGLKIGKDIGKIGFKIGKTFVKIGTKIGLETAVGTLVIAKETSIVSFKIGSGISKGIIKAGEFAVKVNMKKGKEITRFGKKIGEEIAKAEKNYTKEIDESIKIVKNSTEKVDNKVKGQFAYKSQLFQKWKKEADEYPSEIKNRIFDKLSNYLDTTEDESGETINLERKGDYETALEEFKSFVDPETISDMPTSKYGVGLKGRLDGTLYSDLDAPGKISITIRPGSKTGGSTVEIKLAKKRVFKIRYIEDFSINE